MIEPQPDVVDFVVNGGAVAVPAIEGGTLLEILRHHLGLKGAREGCSAGECGACTVMIDGEAVKACQVPVTDAAGTTVVTPEGLGTPEKRHAIQQLFIDEQAAQCGYCVNGIIMTVAALPDSIRRDRTALTSHLDGHVCRCGSHPRILEAVGRIAGGGESPAQMARIGLIADEPVQVSPGDDRIGADAADNEIGRNVADRLRLLAGGRVSASCGKVELGQGLGPALRQIVAAGVGVPVSSVVLEPVGSRTSPDDGNTTGSHSIERGGARLAIASAAFRRMLLDRAGRLLAHTEYGGPLDISDGRIVDSRGRIVATLDDLADGEPVEGPITASDTPVWVADPIGAAVPRQDLESKLSGAPAYVHDLDFPQMLHARVLLPTGHRLRLEHVDTGPVERRLGIRAVLRRESLVILIAEDPMTADRGLRELAAAAQWRTEPTDEPILGSLRNQPYEEFTVRRDQRLGTGFEGNRYVEASYSKPYQAHGPVAPSCAVALAEDGDVTVWTHSQGVHRLATEIHSLLGLAAQAKVDVRHQSGPGCYGFNCADDAAALAALAAQHVPGRHVRLRLTMADEFRWDPLGPAMEADLAAELDPSGRVRAWRHVIYTDGHNGRPDGTGTALIPGFLGARPGVIPWGGATASGARNAEPLYDFPVVESTARYVRAGPRTGELRALGAFFNVFAAESFMNELAEAASMDPVSFRLAHLTDPRARRVLEHAAERSGWVAHVGPSGRGLGIAVARYKGEKAYVAQAVEVEFDDVHGARLARVTTVCDAGTVINPDGLANQLQGGTIQALSRTIYETVPFDADGVAIESWADYPTFGFAETPPIETVLLDRSGMPPLGVGEAALGPAAAAYVNALDDATGIRMRDLPAGRDRIMMRLMAMDPAETARVII